MCIFHRIYYLISPRVQIAYCQVWPGPICVHILWDILHSFCPEFMFLTAKCSGGQSVWLKWGISCQKQVSQAGISNYIPQFTVGCNYLCLPEIPASLDTQFTVGCNYLCLPEIPASVDTQFTVGYNYLCLPEIPASVDTQFTVGYNYLCLPEIPASVDTQFTVGCNYLCLPEIPASGNKVLKYNTIVNTAKH